MEDYLAVVQSAQSQRREADTELEKQMKELFYIFGPDNKGLVRKADILR